MVLFEGMPQALDQNNPTEAISLNLLGQKFNLYTFKTPLNTLVVFYLIAAGLMLVGGMPLIAGVLTIIYTILLPVIAIRYPEVTMTEQTYLSYVKFIGDKGNPHEIIEGEPSRPVFQVLSANKDKLARKNKKL